MDEKEMKDRIMDTLHRLAPLWLSADRASKETGLDEHDCKRLMMALAAEGKVIAASALCSGPQPVIIWRRKAEWLGQQKGGAKYMRKAVKR